MSIPNSRQFSTTGAQSLQRFALPLRDNDRRVLESPGVRRVCDDIQALQGARPAPGTLDYDLEIRAWEDDAEPFDGTE